MICVVHISCNILNTKCIKDLDIWIPDYNLTEFYSQFVSPLFHLFLGLLLAIIPCFLSIIHAPHFRVMTDLHGSPTTESWVNVGRHVLPNGLGHDKTVVSLWDRVLFLWIMSMWSVCTCGRYSLLVGICPVQDVLPRICSWHSSGEIRPRVREEGIAELILFITQQYLLSKKIK